VIRAATEADIPRCIDYTEALVEAVSGPQRVCRLKTGESLAGLLAAPHGAVFVSAGGFIAGQVGHTSISPEIVSFEQGWFAMDRSGIRLLRHFEAWGIGKGATLIHMSCAGGAVQRMLERGGYRAAEIQMCKAVY
jgi:hypothetical protein